MTPRCGVERPKVARLPRSSLIATSQKQCICLRLCLSPYRSDSATAWTHTPGNSLYITEGPSRLTFPFEAHGVCVLILFKQSKGKVGRAEWGHRLDCSRPRYRDQRKASHCRRVFHPREHGNWRRSASYREAAQVGKWNLESAMECRTASPPVDFSATPLGGGGRLVEFSEAPELIQRYPPRAPKVVPFLRPSHTCPRLDVESSVKLAAPCVSSRP